MGKISTTIELQDGMTSPLNNMVNSLNHVISAFESLQNVNGIDVDTSSIQAARNEIEAANSALQALGLRNESIEVPIEPQTPEPLIDDPEPVQVPVVWNSNDFDVFTTTGVERYEQEVQSLNTYLQKLYGTQQRISQQAQNTDLFPENMVSDLNQLQGKIEAIRAKVQQIEDNPLNMGTDDASNQLEQLRSQLHQMIQEQNDLNAAVENLDVSAANSAYNRLNSTIRHTETFIRDNTDAQGQFTNAIQQSEHASNSLMKSLMGFSIVQKLVGMVTGQIDSAINRMDTMSNFTRTMTAITGSANAAQASLNQLKDVTKGTAYGLDVAASAVQNFTTRGLSIGKATDEVSKWADAVAFYGKGTNEQLTTVTDALGKMLSKGKVEMEQLNRLTDAGINAVGMYAQATNQSASAVQDALSDGTISAQEFMTTVSTAFEEGTNGVLNIAGAAKEAGDTWATSIANMKAAVTRGVISVIDSINNALSKAGFGTILSGIKSLGQVMENVLNRIGNMIGTVITMLSPLLHLIQTIGGFIADNWSIIEPIVLGIVAAIAAYNAVMLINNAIQGISNVIKSISAVAAVAHGAALTAEMAATAGMTTAQLAFNAALYACPITWIILAIIAVIALIYVVIAVINKVCDTQISATGVIMGTLATIGAYLFNQIAFWWNIISAFIEFFVNVWKNPEYAIKAFIVNIINAFLNFCMAIVQGNGAAIGVIVGAWYAFCQIIHNIVAAIYNFFAMCIEAIVNAWNQCVYAVQTVLYNIADAAFDVAEGAANGFDAAASAIANAFIGAANTAIGAINSIIGALNKIPGVNIGTISTLSTVSYSGASNAVSAVRSHFSRPSAPETFTLDRMDFGSIGDAYDIGNQVGQDFAAGFESTVADIQAGMQDWLGEKPEDYWEAPKLDYINLGDAAKAGYNFGAGVEDKLSNFGIPDGSDIADLQNTLNDIAGNTGDSAGSGGDTADNTGKMADALDCTDEELKYLRDIAERDVINRFTTAELKVEFHNENTINSDLDIDGIVDEITERTKEELEAVAEGVYS